jgi:hypothetical protein
LLALNFDGTIFLHEAVSEDAAFSFCAIVSFLVKVKAFGDALMFSYLWKHLGSPGTFLEAPGV